MISINLLLIFLVAIFVGVAAGYLGSFMVLKRMSLVGDALTHVALPGIAIALMLHHSPMLGAFIMLTIAIIGVWYLEKTSTVYPETLIGIFFTASLALGILITPEPDLLEALFGNIEKINLVEAVVAIIVSLILILITKLISKKLILGIISDELAKSLKIPLDRINFIYLFLVGTIVAVGVKFVGTLLMGALVIVPAAAAKNISKSIHQYHLFSIAFGILSAMTGVAVSTTYHLPTGPIIVLVSVLIFIVTYLFK